MWESIKRFMMPLVYSDDGQNARSAYWINLFLIVIGLVTFAIGLSIPFSTLDADRSLLLFIVDSLAICVCLAGLISVRRGYVKQTAIVVLLVFFTLITYTNLFVFQTIRSPAVMGYFVLIPLAALTLGKRVMVSGVILCALAVTISFFWDWSETTSSQLPTRVNLNDLLVLYIGLGLNTILLYLNTHDSEESAAIARRTAKVLAETNHELQLSKDALNEANAQQEQIIAQRTEELRIALHAAQAADRAKGQFLSNMSHELRTPMNGVLGMASVLLETELTSDQREFVETIEQSGETMMVLVRELLDFARIEAGVLNLREEPFALADCITQTFDMVAVQAAVKGLELIYDLADDVPDLLVGDAQRLGQILGNLVNNAIKFTHHGEVAITVTLEAQDEDGCALHFSVQDTGIGIPAERIEQMFKPFTQLDESDTRRFGGAGLGLTIARHLCEAMDGSIGATSAVGVGSDFFFTIRLRPGSSSDAVHVAYRQDAAVFAGRCALIVDDNARQRAALRGYLARWGISAHEVDSIAQARQFLNENNSIDLLLLELATPLADSMTDSMTLANELRQQRPAVQILLMSTADQLPIRQGLREQGFEYILSKPIKLPHLYDMLAQHVARQPLIRPSVPRKRDLAVEHPLRILLVEDNVLNQKVATALLKRMGYCVDAVNDGLEAVEVVDQDSYDVIFMDLQMPGMGGLEATRHIRQNEALHEQPWIIALTGAVDEQEQAKCIAVGMDGFIGKPATIDKVQAVIQACVKQAKDIQEGGL